MTSRLQELETPTCFFRLRRAITTFLRQEPGPKWNTQRGSPAKSARSSGKSGRRITPEAITPGTART